jgi:hypothetical protein
MYFSELVDRRRLLLLLRLLHVHVWFTRTCHEGLRFTWLHVF